VGFFCGWGLGGLFCVWVFGFGLGGLVGLCVLFVGFFCVWFGVVGVGGLLGLFLVVFGGLFVGFLGWVWGFGVFVFCFFWVCFLGWCVCFFWWVWGFLFGVVWCFWCCLVGAIVSCCRAVNLRGFFFSLSSASRPTLFQAGVLPCSNLAAQKPSVPGIRISPALLPHRSVVLASVQNSFLFLFPRGNVSILSPSPTKYTG